MTIGEAPRRLAADVEIFHDGQIGKDAAVLGRVAQPAPRDLEWLQGGDVAAVTFGNYLLLSSTIFGAAASTTIFVQLGRDKSRIPQLMASSFRYLVLTSIPLHFIAVALAAPALLLLYGTRYAGAAMVVTIAPLLCMPKAFLAPIQSLLQSAERQSYVILAT